MGGNENIHLCNKILYITCGLVEDDWIKGYHVVVHTYLSGARALIIEKAVVRGSRPLHWGNPEAL